MAKPQHDVATNTKPVEFYSTKKEDIVAYLDGTPISKVLDIDLKGGVVIAKDKNGMYVTTRSFAGTNLLDPYKIYRRVPVTQKEDGTYCFQTRN